MVHIHRGNPWRRRPASAAPVLAERAWFDRRRLIRLLGLGGALAATNALALGQDGARAPTSEGYTEDAYPPSPRWVPRWSPVGGAERYPAPRNARHAGGRPITREDAAARFGNYYEFLPGKAGAVHRRVKDFEARPWTLEIGGLVEDPREVDVDELAGIAPLEERIYRFRCVEAWSMVVPWTGIPLADLVRWCEPKPEARFVRFVSFHDKRIAPRQRLESRYPWPYHEGLRLDEARSELAFLATGIYGHGLPAQHGAPVRLVVPWKYGYKSPKAIVRIEFTAENPGSFWSEKHPREYPFESNVDPAQPHPRWSQATERDLETGDRIPTLPFNGYGDEVGALYA